jgi:hypothetical protein
LRQRNKLVIIKHSENPTPKQDSWRATCKLKLPHLTEGGADKAAASERQKKEKKKHYPTTWRDYNRDSA